MKTPFDATFILEEDIIELCTEIGQTQPKGVLWFLVTESVVLFHSCDKMLATVHSHQSHSFNEEPIRFHTAPPSNAHGRAYLVVGDGQPLRAQSPTPDRKEIPQ